jgi:hypothetical protein
VGSCRDALTLIATRFFFYEQNPVTFIERFCKNSVQYKLLDKLTEVPPRSQGPDTLFIRRTAAPGIVVTSMILLAAGCFVLSVRIITQAGISTGDYVPPRQCFCPCWV